MIEKMTGLPSNVIGFKASGEVSMKDYKDIIFPEVKKQVDKEDKLNYVFLIDAPLNDFTTGAWISDAWLGLKESARWRRVAIVSDVEKIRHFTGKAGKWVPGEYKGFPVAELKEAIAWAGAPEQIPAH
jgi:hypothetical protein